MDEAGAIAQLERSDDGDNDGEDPGDAPIVDEHVVARVVSEMTGIPLGKLESTEMDRLQALESDLETRVKGQRRAVRGVARAIRRARSGLRDPKRPVASFLLWYVTRQRTSEMPSASNMFVSRHPEPSTNLSYISSIRSGGTGTGKTELIGKGHDTN
jgi:hypothetical protein